MIVRVLGGLARNRELLRIELAFAGFNAAEWGVWIAMLVYAYDHGGATAAGLVAVAQLLPAALFAPAASSLADRHAPTRVLAGGYVAQAGAMGATAVVLLADGPPLAAYACAALAATAVTITRPAQAVLMPALARTPEELTAANVVSGWIESVSMLAAPALAGVLLAAGGAGTVFAVMAAVAAGSAVLAGSVAGPPATGGGPTLEQTRSAAETVVHEPGPRALVWLLGIEALAIGALDVLYVVLAVGILHHAGSVAGYLNAAFGAGGVIGVVATAALVGRRRLAPALIAGFAAWALALAAIAAVPSTASALGFLALAGVGRIVIDVAGRTLLQRIAPPQALARVFGLLEAVSMVGLAVGSIATSAFVALFGARGAFACFAVLLPLAAALVLRGLLGADSVTLPIVEIARLRALPLFAPLRAPELEALARAVRPVTAPAGEAVIREGESGDFFYVIADGELSVSKRGEAVAVLGRGDCFGEIALLHDVPRTATVTARTAVQLDALDKTSFLTAVTGHDSSARAADALVHARLDGARIAQ